jgi:glycosyltransferase involved in cell wall biosynthesis
MKVLVVGPSKKFLSGISYYTIRLANTLATDHNVSVLCLRNLLPRFMFPGHRHVGKQISSLEYDSKVRVYDGMDYNNPLTWMGAVKFIRREKPDVVVLQWWTSSVAHMHLIIALFTKARIVVEFHEVVDPLEESILPIRLYAKHMGRFIVKRASSYVTHSESDKNLVSERYGVSPDDVNVVPLGLFDHYARPGRDEARRRLGVDPTDHAILFFGLIRPYKGVGHLIQAFDDLPDDVAARSRLFIVGEMWESGDEVKNAVSSSAHQSRIRVVDEYVSDVDVGYYFTAADVVVLPYTRASQSGVAHIAMSYDKPVIVSRVGGLEESMTGYPGTVFVPPGVVADLRDAILESEKSPQVIHHDPNRGWDKIRELYNHEVLDARS